MYAFQNANVSRKAEHFRGKKFMLIHGTADGECYPRVIWKNQKKQKKNYKKTQQPKTSVVTAGCSEGILPWFLVFVLPSWVIKWVCVPIHTHPNPWGKLKWPSANTSLTAHITCGLMSAFVICKRGKECFHTWDQMSLLRSDVIKNTKFSIVNILKCSCCLPDNVHFQHTAQFIKALTHAEVNFRIQVNYKPIHHPKSWTFKLWDKY